MLDQEEINQTFPNQLIYAPPLKEGYYLSNIHSVAGIALRALPELSHFIPTPVR